MPSVRSERDRHRRVALHAERAELVVRLALAALVHRDEHRIVRRVRVHRARPLVEVGRVALLARLRILQQRRRVDVVAAGHQHAQREGKSHAAIVLLTRGARRAVGSERRRRRATPAARTSRPAVGRRGRGREIWQGADRDGREHRGADRAGVRARRDAVWAADDVGADLHPHRARDRRRGRRRRRGAHGREPIDDVAAREREALEHRARDVRRDRGAAREAVERAARVGPPHRRHRAGERGDERDAVGAGRRGAASAIERGVVAQAEQRASPSAIAPPDSQPGFSTKNAPVGYAWVSTIGSRRRIEDRGRRERADDLGGAERARDRAGRGDARAERRREVVAGADRDRRAGRQAGERAPRGERAGDRATRARSRAAAPGAIANAASSSARPRAGGEIVEHRRRRVRRIDRPRRRSGARRGSSTGWWKRAARTPARAASAIFGARWLGSATCPVIARTRAGDRRARGGRAAVLPDQRGMQRRAGGIDRDAAVELAGDRERGDVGRRRSPRRPARRRSPARARPPTRADPARPSPGAGAASRSASACAPSTREPVVAHDRLAGSACRGRCRRRRIRGYTTRVMNYFGHAAVASWTSARARRRCSARCCPTSRRCAAVGSTRSRDAAIAAGVALHHATDGAFHELPAVTGLMRELDDRLAAAGCARGPRRAVAHIGVELLLDGVLVDDRVVSRRLPRRDRLRRRRRVAATARDASRCCASACARYGVPDDLRAADAIAARLAAHARAAPAARADRRPTCARSTPRSPPISRASSSRPTP